MSFMKGKKMKTNKSVNKQIREGNARQKLEDNYERTRMADRFRYSADRQDAIVTGIVGGIVSMLACWGLCALALSPHMTTDNLAKMIETQPPAVTEELTPLSEEQYEKAKDAEASYNDYVIYWVHSKDKNYDFVTNRLKTKYHQDSGKVLVTKSKTDKNTVSIYRPEEFEGTEYFLLSLTDIPEGVKEFVPNVDVTDKIMEAIAKE